jgi:molybdopterin adenylyltransferase
MSRKLKIGIINVSDRASRGEYEDLPGKAAKDWLSRVIKSKWECKYSVIPDEQSQIEAELIEMSDQFSCSLILTTGGTGPAFRDVTPEATRAVCEKMLPGFGEQMRRESLKYVPTAILSRQSAGIRGKSLLINLPGSPKAISECLVAVFPAIPYCIDLIGGERIETHENQIRAFRPDH